LPLFLISCTPKYGKATKLNYYGYVDKTISDNSYQIEYKVNFKTSLKQCIDFSLVRASKLALEKNNNFIIKDLEAYRSYEKNFKKFNTIYIGGAAAAGAQGGAIGGKYAEDRVGISVLKIDLSDSKDAINSCGLCNVISKKYGADHFENNFCNCKTNEEAIKKAEISLEQNYSKFDQGRLNRIFGSINVFNPNGDIQSELDQVKESKI
jgi:hypothetical protein